MVVVTNQVLDMIRAGDSLNKISRETGLYKSTLYYHYKKIKGKKYKEPKYKIKFSEKEGEIVGILAGDGSQYYYKRNGGYQTTIHFGDYPNRVEYVKKLYENYFNKNWTTWRGVTKKGFISYRIRVINKKIFDYFKNYLSYIAKHKHDTVKLKNLKLSKRFKIGFLRGWIDTDGTVCQTKNGLKIAIYTTSKIMAKQIKILFKDLNINTNIYKSIRPPYKDIYIINVLADSRDKLLNTI